MRKGIIAFLLSVVMIFSMSLTAFAAEGNVEDATFRLEYVEDHYEARVINNSDKTIMKFKYAYGPAGSEDLTYGETSTILGGNQFKFLTVDSQEARELQLYIYYVEFRKGPVVEAKDVTSDSLGLVCAAPIPETTVPETTTKTTTVSTTTVKATEKKAPVFKSKKSRDSILPITALVVLAALILAGVVLGKKQNTPEIRAQELRLIEAEKERQKTKIK